MRLPFLSRRDPDAPQQVPLRQRPDPSYAVYFASVAQLHPETDLRPMVASWLRDRLEDPLRPRLLDLWSQEALRLTVHDAAEVPSPPAEVLQYLGSGEAERERFRSARRVVAVHAGPEADDPERLHLGFWLPLAAAQALAASLEGVVLDPAIPRLLSLESLSRPLPPEGRIVPVEHIVLPYSDQGRGRVWITSKGLGRFGLPELELRSAPGELLEPGMRLMNGLAQHLLELLDSRGTAQTGELEVGPEVLLNVEQVAHGNGAQIPEDAPPYEPGETRVGLQYLPGKGVRDPFLRLGPPRGFRGDGDAWLHAALGELFGQEDPVSTMESDDPAMREAHLRAVSELPEVRRRFQEGLPEGEALYLKQGFDVGRQGTEYMWVEVRHWSGDQIGGVLANDSRFRGDLRAGREVRLRERDVYDWLLRHSDGEMEGNYTMRAAGVSLD